MIIIDLCTSRSSFHRQQVCWNHWHLVWCWSWSYLMEDLIGYRLCLFHGSNQIQFEAGPPKFEKTWTEWSKQLTVSLIVLVASESFSSEAGVRLKVFTKLLQQDKKFDPEQIWEILQVLESFLSGLLLHDLKISKKGITIFSRIFVSKINLYARNS